MIIIPAYPNVKLSVWTTLLRVAEEVLGMKVTHQVKHPKYMLFVDEVSI